MSPPEDHRQPLGYETPFSGVQAHRKKLGVARRCALAVGLGLLCFGAGWGLAPRPPHHIETAWMMGVGAAIVGFCLPSIRP